MRINCTIDGIKQVIDTESTKPLSRILSEVCPNFSSHSRCLSSSCGNCLVLLNNRVVLSCLIPAFKLSGSTICTFEHYKNTENYKDVEKAFNEVGNKPCKQCIASKILIIESLINKLEAINTVKSYSVVLAHNRTATVLVDQKYIKQEMSVNCCKCMDVSEIEKVVYIAYHIRRNRNARNS